MNNSSNLYLSDMSQGLIFFFFLLKPKCIFLGKFFIKNDIIYYIIYIYKQLPVDLIIMYILYVSYNNNNKHLCYSVKHFCKLLWGKKHNSSNFWIKLL